VICCPAIVSVAVRRELVGFAAAEMFTVPFPLPLAPDVMLIQLAFVAAAVHEQLFVVVTVNELRLLPDEGNESVVGFTTYEQVGVADAAACVTVTTRPAMVSVPVRWAPVFAAALNVTESGPKLWLSDVIVNHPALLAALHSQPSLVSIDSVEPAPPCRANRGDGRSNGIHARCRRRHDRRDDVRGLRDTNGAIGDHERCACARRRYWWRRRW
jgi:hypothetical protein